MFRLTALKVRRPVIRPAVRVNYSNLGHSTDIYGTWYESYAFRVLSKNVIFNFLQSVITTWLTRDLVRRQLQ